MNTAPQPESAPREQDLLSAVRACLETADTAALRALLHAAPPADVARVLGDLPDELAAGIFRMLDAETGAEVLDELGAADVQALAETAPKLIAEAAEELEPDEVADLLEVLPDEQADALLKGFPQEQATAAERLLTYPPDSAGGLMTTQFVSLPRDATAREAIEITQRSRDSETVAHLFVSDRERRLVGYLPLQRLVFAPPDRKVGELMEGVPHAVSAETDQEEVVRAATRYDLASVPVVDQAGRLIGVVTVDDILEAAEQEADEDMYRLAGTGERDPVHASIYRSTRLRLPWLLLSVADGLFIAYLLSRFEGTLRVVELAFFIPLIPLMGGQVAIQSSTIIVRGLALGNLRRSMMAQFMSRQFVITLLLALSCALFAGLIGSLLVGAEAQLMLAVGLAVWSAILISGMLGMTAPLVFNAVGVDPAVSSGPFITMLNDLICICIYLVLGMLLAPA
jgi:magnesium transporter